MDLYQELQQKINELNISIKELRKSGTSYAQAERDYKILLRSECLKLRDSGMAIGMIDKTCYGIPAVADARFKRDVAEAGIPAVADARFKRDVAEAVYKANLEAINSIKLQMRLLENQIQREFGANLAD